MKTTFQLKFRRRKGQSNGHEPGPFTVSERLGALRHLIPLFKLIWQASPLMTTANVLIRVVSAVMPLALLYTGKLIINEVVHLTQTPGPPNMNWLWTLVLIEFGLVILNDILARSINLLESLLGDVFSNVTSVRMIEHAGKLDLEQFENPVFYDKLDRARNRTVDRVMLMSQAFGQVQSLLTMVVLAVSLITFSPWFILLLIVTVLPAFLGEAHFSSLAYSLTYQWTPERRELDYLRWTSASVETAKEVKIFGLAQFLKERYRQLANRYYRANRSLAIRRASWSSLFSMVGNVGYYVAFALFVMRTASGQLSIGDLSFLIGAFSRLRGLVQGFLFGFAMMSEGALYTKDLFDFFLLQPSVRPPPKPRPFPKPIKHGFTFENVGFKYPNTDRWVLRNLSFTLHVGEKLALVGANGAGKTTLVKLLSRLYDPQEGRILLDGYDLREYDPNELLHEIGIIFQDYVRYQLTAAENIAIGQIEARDDRPRIQRAAQRSQAEAAIEKLPTGYDQLIGRRFDGGVDLSGGEWQKIALARAYMRDAQLLILDEPTASLDAEAEHEVFKRFSELSQSRTAALISHRFSTVRMADRIMVLEDGQCHEIGTHKELLALNGRYAQLFSLQAEGYR
jgi:ATP-binding cassette subfamily B protein